MDGWMEGGSEGGTGGWRDGGMEGREGGRQGCKEARRQAGRLVDGQVGLAGGPCVSGFKSLSLVVQISMEAFVMREVNVEALCSQLILMHAC